MRHTRAQLTAALCLAALWSSVAAGQPQDGAVVTPLAGAVAFRQADTETYQVLDEARRLPSSSQVRTGPQSWAAIQYDGGTRVTVKPEAGIRVGGDPEGGIMVELGAVLVRARRLLGEEHRVRTPVAVAAIRAPTSACT